MGIGFVIFIHLVAIFIIGIFISIVAGAITIIYYRKDKKRRHRIFLSLIAPFFGLYTFYFTGLFGCTIVSEIKNVDIGIGDSFYVPLIDNCSLHFTDLPEYAYISNDGREIIENISDLQQTDYLVFCKTYNNEFFSYDIENKLLKKFENESSLQMSFPEIKIELVKTYEFYVAKRKSVIGSSLIIVGTVAFILSLAILYLLKKAILGYMRFR